MIPSDVRDRSWLDAVGETDCAIVVMEGISMYLDPGELAAVLKNLTDRFDRVALLTDCYTGLAARISRYKNPINDVGVTKVYGLDNPEVLARNGLQFLREHPMTPRCYLDCLSGGEKRIFSRLYAGGFSKRLYRLFEYRKG